MRAMLLGAILVASACGNDGPSCQEPPVASICPLGTCPAHFTADPAAVCPTNGTYPSVRFYSGCRGFDAIAFIGTDVTEYAVYRASDASLAGYATFFAPDGTSSCSPGVPEDFDAFSWCTSSWEVRCPSPGQ